MTPRKIRAPVKGSRNDWLSSFEVGEKRYIETTLKGFPADMRSITSATSRRPAVMHHMRFKSSFATAVFTATAGDVRFLLCVERLA